MDAPRSGNPGLAYGFRATPGLAICLDVHYKTPSLRRLFSLPISPFSLYSLPFLSPPFGLRQPPPPNHPSWGIFLKPSRPLGRVSLPCYGTRFSFRCSIVPVISLLYRLGISAFAHAEPRWTAHFWASTRNESTSNTPLPFPLSRSLLDFCALLTRSHICGRRVDAPHPSHGLAPHCAIERPVPPFPPDHRGNGASATHCLTHDLVEDRLRGPHAVVSALIIPPHAHRSFGRIRSPIRSVIRVTLGLDLSMMTRSVSRMRH